MNGEREPDLIDAMLAVIRSAGIDSQTARMAASVIAVDANFNARVSSRKAKNIEEEEYFNILDFYENIILEARAIASNVRHGSSCKEAGERLRALRSRIADYEIKS